MQRRRRRRLSYFFSSSRFKSTCDAWKTESKATHQQKKNTQKNYLQNDVRERRGRKGGKIREFFFRLKKSLRWYLSCHVECRLKTWRRRDTTRVERTIFSSFFWWSALEFKLWLRTVKKLSEIFGNQFFFILPVFCDSEG